MRTWTLILLTLLPFTGMAQLYESGTPWLLNNQAGDDIPVFEMPAIQDTNINITKTNSSLKPYHFGKNFPVNIDIKKDGKVLQNTDSTTIYLIGLQSKGAFSLSLMFIRFQLPEKARLFVINPEKNHFLGAYTSRNNKKAGNLAIQPVKGDKIYIEYTEHVQNDEGELVLGTLSHHYKDIFNQNALKDSRFGSSGDCNIDINCPEGDDYQHLKHAICRILINGNTFCTGTLINNTAENGKPYILTANHCIDNQQAAESVVAVFNYESPYCSGNDGSVKQSISGAELKATKSNLDFSLLELSEKIPTNFKPYYAGWNKKETPPDSSICIHHPSGDVKKIAIDHDAPVTDSYQDGFIINAFWRVEEWDKGTTESGSSGAPLFNSHNQLYGLLSGGSANCSAPVNDYFVKFSENWDYYPDFSEQLAYWLDPVSLNTDSLAGYDPSTRRYQNDARMFHILSPASQYCGTYDVKPKVLVKNNGLDTIKSLTISYQINEGSESESLQYNQPILPGELDTIGFKVIHLTAEDYTFQAFTSQPDNEPDDNPQNDTLSMAFTIKSGIPTRLNLTTDYFGSETIWEIKDNQDSVVYEGGPYQNGAINNITESFCLDYEDYAFSIYDILGDGICCDYGFGQYALINGNTNEIISQGGIFDSVETTTLKHSEPSPVADFTADTNIIFTHSDIRFQNKSKHAETLKWHFEGGDPSLSTEDEPVVHYALPGKYDVSLSVNNNEDKKLREDYVYVVDSPKVVDFVAWDTLVYQGDSIRYVDRSHGIKNRKWVFEGGDPAMTEMSNPEVTYQNSGIYDVTLIGDEDSLKKHDYIHVRKKPIIYEITYPDSVSCIHEPVTFSIFPDTLISSVQWNFEGGQPDMSEKRHPEIIYLSEGHYQARVIINDTIEIIQDNAVHIYDPPRIELIKEDESSDGQQDGWAAVKITGGKPPYQITWNTYNKTDSIADMGPGLYSVAVRDMAGCMVTKPVRISTDSASVIQPKSLITGYQVYPNPTSRLIHLDISDPAFRYFAIYDIKGNKYISGNILKRHTSIDLSDYADGIYLLRISSPTGTFVHKIILEK